MMHWLNMGGYAVYLWPSYLLTLLVVALNVYWARGAAQRARDEARRRFEMDRSRS
jgi:heme exporter protein CcmD